MYLERDRDWLSLSLGMGGGLLLPRRIKRREIRAEGYRRGYRGDALDDFVEIVSALDDERVARLAEASAKGAKASADSGKTAAAGKNKRR